LRPPQTSSSALHRQGCAGPAGGSREVSRTDPPEKGLSRAVTGRLVTGSAKTFLNRHKLRRIDPSSAGADTRCRSRVMT
jgi:hypothetical protein